MQTDHKKKALAGIKRLEGVTKKVREMIETDEYCPHILENLLAMQGHIKHVQGEVLESHLHTCAREKMKQEKDYAGFIAEIIRTIGLSSR
jgi:CsoR family transcriptional regulator, copper-sensing transcriptional repressor